MASWFDLDWEHILLPQTPLVETILRGSLMYLALFALMRVVLKREAGAVGITDLLVVVLIADAAQNAIADDYRSVPDGIVLVGTIVFWAWALDWLGYRFPRIQRLIHPRSLPLVRDGRMLRRNMAKELITDDELMSQIRQQGIDDLSQVESAAMEGDGRISVVARDSKHDGAQDRSRV